MAATLATNAIVDAERMSAKPTPADPCLPADELIALMHEGNMAALDRMTRCYGASLVAVGRRYCRTESEAADAVQDALLSAGEHLRQFRGDGSPEGWLVRMVINACRRMSRGQKNAAALHVGVEELGRASSGDDPENAAQRGELAEALGHALTSLSPRERALLLLADAEEWTAAELGAEFGLTAGAVRTRLSRIRAKLRPQLQEALFAEPMRS